MAAMGAQRLLAWCVCSTLLVGEPGAHHPLPGSNARRAGGVPLRHSQRGPAAKQHRLCRQSNMLDRGHRASCGPPPCSMPIWGTTTFCCTSGGCPRIIVSLCRDSLLSAVFLDQRLVNGASADGTSIAQPRHPAAFA